MLCFVINFCSLFTVQLCSVVAVRFSICLVRALGTRKMFLHWLLQMQVRKCNVLLLFGEEIVNCGCEKFKCANT